MNYGINVEFLAKDIGVKKAAELAANAGFTKLDYTPDLAGDNWQSGMKEDLKIFEEYGLQVHQTHAPFNRYGRYGDQHKQYLDRCAEATEYMGAKFIAVHGDEFDSQRLTYSPEAALEYNHDLFLPYVERAQKGGYKIAFETVFNESPNHRRFTARADELMDLITSFGSEHAVCCWDFGHAHMSFRQEAVDHIRRFGSLIQCTHLHDNAGNDSHQLPMTGKIDWNATVAAFKKIGYDGVLSIEYSHGSMPEHLLKEYIDLTFKTAEYLWTL